MLEEGKFKLEPLLLAGQFCLTGMHHLASIKRRRFGTARNLIDAKGDDGVCLQDSACRIHLKPDKTSMSILHMFILFTYHLPGWEIILHKVHEIPEDYTN